MQTHRLKSWPEFFSMHFQDIKMFDLRKNDRGYKVGDMVQLEEWSPTLREFSGRTMRARINYILQNFDGLKEGYCILGYVNED